MNLLHCGIISCQNRQIPGYIAPHFQNESSCKTFDMKISGLFLKRHAGVIAHGLLLNVCRIL